MEKVLLLLLLLLTLVASSSASSAPHFHSRFDLNGPCRPLVSNFTASVQAFSNCTLNYAIPPIVCFNCFEHFVNLTQTYNDLINAHSTYSLANETCQTVVFSDYKVSYVKVIYDTLNKGIWQASNCDRCLDIDFTRKDPIVPRPNPNLFMAKFFEWRNCTDWHFAAMTTTEMNNKNRSKAAPLPLCADCEPQYTSLYGFYWKTIVSDDSEACLDVESTMNDTMQTWRDVYHCIDGQQGRSKESMMVVVLTIVLTAVLVVFYVASFVQGERKKRHLIQYSRLREPQGPRSRLLSGSLHPEDDDDDERFAELPHSSILRTANADVQNSSRRSGRVQ